MAFLQNVPVEIQAKKTREYYHRYFPVWYCTAHMIPLYNKECMSFVEFIKLTNLNCHYQCVRYGFDECSTMVSRTILEKILRKNSFM